MTRELLFSLEENAMEHWRNGDPMKWAEISADEVTYVDPGLTSPIVGLENYTQYLRQIEGRIHYDRSEFIDPRILLTDEAALLTYNYRSSSVNSTSSTQWNTTEVYARTVEGWKIIHTHWSYVNHTRPERLVIPLPVETNPKPFVGVAGELMALESAAMERWRKGDPYGFIELSDPEVTYFDTGTPRRINGLNALKAEYDKRSGKIFYDVMDFIDPHIQVHGDLAVLFYRFLSTRLTPDGSIASRTPWNCTEVFIHRQGSWRILHTHWSLIQGVRVNE